MKRNLDETWKLCLQMWKWIAKKRKEGSPKAVWKLKEEWFANHKLTGVCNNCFFCDWAIQHDQNIVNIGGGCFDCPGTRVDNSFYCGTFNYAWEVKPIAFYKKLVALNKIRLVKKKGRK